MVTAMLFAGGIGARMKYSDMPKQFLEVGGKPIIIHTMEHFARHPKVDAIVVACKADWIGYLNELIAAFNVLGYTTLHLSSWINNQYALNIRSRWKIHVVYITVMFLYLLLNYGLLIFAKILAGATNLFTFVNGGWQLLIVVWLVELVILGLVLSNRSILNALRLQKKAAKLQAENDTALYTALQNQLNPHFLFNTLNALYGLVLTKSDKTESAFIKFSNILKYMYAQTTSDLISISNEVEYIRQYVDLQSLRLNKHTKVVFETEMDDEQIQIPPMILITFVENSFKYGVSSDTDCTIFIRIIVKEGQLIFETENMIMKENHQNPHAIGIDNCRKRLELLYPNRFVLLTKEENGYFKTYLNIQLR